MKNILSEFLASRAVYASSRKKIGVFAGHDDDTWESKGAKGIKTDLEEDGVYEEYDSNIEIAKDTVKLLREHSEFIVYFPQENGRDMGLHDRVEYCNNHGLDIAILIHSNASGSQNATGACAFHYPSSGGRKLAGLYRDIMKDMGYPLWSNGTYECNKQDGWSWFYVVTRTTMPVVLTENFFFTTRSELKKYLLDPEQLDRLSYAHYAMACKYFNVSPKPENREKRDVTTQSTEEVTKVYKKDAEPSASLKGEVDKAVEAGISDGTYPHRPTTREESMVMDFRTLELAQEFNVRQTLVDEFKKLRENLPLEDPDVWQEKLEKGNVTKDDLIYLTLMIAMRNANNASK